MPKTTAITIASPTIVRASVPPVPALRTAAGLLGSLSVFGSGVRSRWNDPAPRAVVGANAAAAAHARSAAVPLRARRRRTHTALRVIVPSGDALRRDRNRHPVR